VDLVRDCLPDGMKLVVNHGPIFQFLFRMMGAEAMSYAMVENPDLLRAVADKVGELSVQIVESRDQYDPRHGRLSGGGRHSRQCHQSGWVLAWAQ